MSTPSLLLATFSILLRTAFSASLEDCALPKQRGERCDSAAPRQVFAFDEQKGSCVPFYYLGCGGNANSFAKFSDCHDLCIAQKVSKLPHINANNLTVDVCSTLTDAKITEVAQKCSSDDQCKNGYSCDRSFCCPTKNTICNLPASSGSEGPDGRHFGRYVYMPGLKNCIRFSYFGQEGNFNNFKTYNDCKKYCT